MRRKEVAQTLKSHETPVTTLRASLVVGPESSAVHLLMSLVRRLPIVVVPRWACGRKQPIALVDVVRAVRYCLGNAETYSRHYDIGGPAVLTYIQILEKAAEALGKKRTMVALPCFPPRLYRWWVRLMDRKAHPGLVRLLVDAIRHDMVARDNPLQRLLIKDALLCRNALDPYLQGHGEGLPANPREATRRLDETQLREESRVRSIQRLTLPPGRNAGWMAQTYFEWLSRFLWPIGACKIDGEGTCHIFTRPLRLPLLTLTFQADRSSPSRQMYFITGGILAKQRASPAARFEFRDVLEGRFTIGAIHDFAPSLPWGFYSATQARAHLFTMKCFQRYLAKRTRQLSA
jgi:hypothetical protein